jgi:hypothetical protein
MTSYIAIDIPKRLGPDADRAEIASDRKVSRRICNLYLNIWHNFHVELQAPAPPEWGDMPLLMRDSIMDRVSSTVIWKKQIPYLIDVVERRMYNLINYEDMAIADQVKGWYSRRSYILEHEMEHLHRINEFMQEEEQRIRAKYAAMIIPRIAAGSYYDL